MSRPRLLRFGSGGRRFGRPPGSPHWASLAMALLAGSLFGLAGQSPPASTVAQEPGSAAVLREIGQRIGTLRPRVDSAQLKAQRADSLHADSVRQANQIPLDTVLVGPLRIATVPDQGELAQDLFSQVWNVFGPLVRGSENLLRDQLFVFRHAWRFEGMYVEGDGVHSVEMSRRFGQDRLKAKIRDALGHALIQVLPDSSMALARWVGMAPLTPPLDWSWIYRELASTPSMAVRQCYRGEPSWCWEALGLSETEGGWEAWYSPEERRLLVESRYSGRLNPSRLRMGSLDLLVHGCVEMELDRACLAILEEWPERIPLGNSARASMVAEALSHGGVGAFTRLIQNPRDPLKDRLAYAAGLPADTLAGRWRNRVLAARPRVQAGLVGSGLTLTLWLLLFLYLATRSTRWRLG